MAPKKTVKRKKPAGRGALETVRELTRRAQQELAELLKRNEEGILGPSELETRLKELHERLKEIAFHEFKL
jgi:signal transduction histidine kinase